MATCATPSYRTSLRCNYEGIILQLDFRIMNMFTTFKTLYVCFRLKHTVTPGYNSYILSLLLSSHWIEIQLYAGRIFFTSDTSILAVDHKLFVNYRCIRKLKISIFFVFQGFAFSHITQTKPTSAQLIDQEIRPTKEVDQPQQSKPTIQKSIVVIR